MIVLAILCSTVHTQNTRGSILANESKVVSNYIHNIFEKHPHQTSKHPEIIEPTCSKWILVNNISRIAIVICCPPAQTVAWQNFENGLF